MLEYTSGELIGNTKKLCYEERIFYAAASNLVSVDHKESDGNARHKHIDASHRSNHDFNLKRIKSLFTAKPPCNDGERSQSYMEWKSFTSWNKLSSWSQFKRWRRQKVYILPIGPMPDCLLTSSLGNSTWNLMKILEEFVTVFFPGLCVCFLPTIEYKEILCKTRIHAKSNQLQLLLSGRCYDFLIFKECGY